MGDYIHIDGIGDVKIGTCGDLYYITHAQLKAAVDEGKTSRLPNNQEPADYLLGNHRFRFPFPDEDGTLPGQYQPYDRGKPIMVDTDFVARIEGHTSLYSNLTNGRRAPIPCPLSPEGRKLSPSAWGIFHIVQQRPVEGLLRTVIQCPHCRNLWSLDVDDAIRFAGFVKTTPTTEDSEEVRNEITRRILAGYNLLPESNS